MLTIACVLRSGGIYTPRWVAALQAQCQRWAPPHRFVCLSDVDVPCERIQLRHDWPGWWAKLELFAVPGPVLFFDLDTLIIGDLSDIAAQAKCPTFTVLRHFYRLGDRMASGMMAWNVDMGRLYVSFCKDPAGWQRFVGQEGDQGFIEHKVHPRDAAFWQDSAPGQVVSYKAGNCRDAPPRGARAVCFHGPRKPHNCGGWAQEMWEQSL